MKKFTAVSDIKEVKAIVQSAIALKDQPYADQALGKNKTLVLLFFNPSLRTRLSTQKAAMQLGMQVMTMNANQGWKLEVAEGAVMNLDKAEHIKEAAGVISQYADIIGIRSFPTLTDRAKDYADEVLHTFIKYASVPVLSLESAIRHPLQSLADAITIQEYRKVHRPKVVLTYAPHPRALPQAVANSFAEWMLAWDAVDLVITHPKGMELSEIFTKGARIEYDQRAAFEGADFIYAKNWSAYRDYGKRPKNADDWMVDTAKMSLTNDAYFMHCLPVRRNVVVADAVIDSPKSLVLQQAYNRVFAAQVVLKTLLE
ncbi:MAG: N-acetylornithine carbamoyltransferase [Bacteroidota bacterium]